MAAALRPARWPLLTALATSAALTLNDASNWTFGGAYWRGDVADALPRHLVWAGLTVFAIGSSFALRGAGAVTRVERAGEGVHSWLPWLALGIAAWLLGVITLLMAYLEVTDRGGLAFAGFYPWALPRYVAMSTLAFALWARWGRRGEAATDRRWVRTAVLTLAGVVELAAALHLFSPPLESVRASILDTDA